MSHSLRRIVKGKQWRAEWEKCSTQEIRKKLNDLKTRRHGDLADVLTVRAVLEAILKNRGKEHGEAA